MNDFVTSLIRTWTPMLVGAVVSWLATRGVNLDPEAAAGLAAFIAGLFSALYYLLVRLIERKYPEAGVLLGSTKKPNYKETR